MVNEVGYIFEGKDMPLEYLVELNKSPLIGVVGVEFWNVIYFHWTENVLWHLVDPIYKAEANQNSEEIVVMFFHNYLLIVNLKLNFAIFLSKDWEIDDLARTIRVIMVGIPFVGMIDC